MSKLIKCKSCGAEIAKSAKSCPQCGAKNKQPIFARWWFWAIIVLVVIAVAAAGGSSGPEAAPEGGSAESTKAPDDGIFGVGERVVMDDIYVTLNSVTESTGSTYYEPDEGNVYVICEFTIENDSDEELAVSSMMSFSAYADDFTAKYSLGGITSADKQQLDGTVAAGKKMNGVIAFEVPADWSELEVHFTPNVYSTEKFVFTHSK